MLSYIYQSLMFFRNIFSRHSTWLIFCMVILGFAGSGEMIGVTSFCRFWSVGDSGYHAFLNFFRSTAWSVEMLICYWATFALSQNETIFVHGRAVLLGDHTNTSKEGRRMPCAVSLHQHSETQSKPSYFRGHCWGAIGLMIGSMALPYCLPLALGIHQGLVHIGKKNEDENSRETMGTRIIRMALDFAVRSDLPATLVLDAFFPSGAIFKTAYSIWSVMHKCPLITLIIRAKKNCTAYFEAEKSAEVKRGRPAIYGEKVKLMELFDHKDTFEKIQCTVYGKTEEILITSVDLLWKPADSLIRFVLAVTSRGPIVLMCSDLAQEPVSALQLYCVRIRIETMFDMLKNLIGGFHYRFWSKSLERQSRKPKKNKTLRMPSEKRINSVKCCHEAYERFVMLAAITLGLMQLISIKYQGLIWNRYEGFLRTRSRQLPSERTVKSVVTNLLNRNLINSAPGAIVQEINERYGEKKTIYQRAA